ncbi:MAG: DNA methylase, partial [bacterium]
MVFDGFAGTGMTGVAARLCADPKEVQALGYRIRDDGTILNEQGQPFSKLGARYAAISDLSAIATFVSYGYTMPVNISLFEEEIKRVIGQIQTDLGWMFETTHTNGRTNGTINYTVFSDIFICPECGAEIVFWDQAVDHDKAEMRNQMTCSACSTLVSKRNAEHAWKTEYDPAIKTTVKQAKQVPVLIDYDVGNKRFTKRPDKNDFAVLRKISELKESHWFPSNRMPVGDESRRNDNIGITHTHHFYEKRTRLVLAYFAHLAASSPCARHLGFVFTSAHQYCNRLCRLHLGNYFHRKGGTVDKPLEGTLYFPSLSLETNTISRLRLRSRLRGVFNSAGFQSFISCQSLTDFPFLPDESVDYTFVDPPFGSNISYSDLNFLWESWLKVLTNNKKEAIESRGQNKKIRDYHGLMQASFAEVFRILKPGRWITIEFSNTKAAIWNSIQTALQEVGFVVSNVSAIDKQKGSFKAVTTPTAVKQDLVISAYKPNGGLESRFAKKAETEEGVWEFIRTHLGNLPVVKPRGGQLEPIAERDPRILFDRTVAFYVRHGIPVPISSP